MAETEEPQTVRDVMYGHVVVAHLHETVARARERLDADNAPALVVVDGDLVAAVADRLTLGSLLADDADPDKVHLRDGIGPPVAFCYADDDLKTARATFERTGAPALAVVDEGRRVVGVLTANVASSPPPVEAGREPVELPDQSDASHPKLDVYAPWAVVPER